MKNILSSLNLSEKNRILESHRRATALQYLKEDDQMCSAEDQKPSSSRPACQKGQSGSFFVSDNQGYVMYKDESGCPKLCKVLDKSIVTLS